LRARIQFMTLGFKRCRDTVMVRFWVSVKVLVKFKLRVSVRLKFRVR
jgi:hypothetical protein